MYLNPSEAERIPKENVKDGLRRSRRERLIREARAVPGGEGRILRSLPLQIRKWSLKLAGKLRSDLTEIHPAHSEESEPRGRLAGGGAAGR